MPFTFFSHQAPALPLKIGWPGWSSGQALVLGSMAPDFQFFLTGRVAWGSGHTALGQFTFCLPITLAMVWIVSRVIARPLALHLPDAGSFHLHDYRVLAETPRTLRYWIKAVPSALIGSFSHLFWDSFTHPVGWAAKRLGYAYKPLFTIGSHPLMACKVLQHGSTLIGGLVTILMLRYIGQNRLLLRWAGELTPVSGVKPSAASHGLLWAPPIVFGLVGFALNYCALHAGHLGAGLPFWSTVLLRSTTCVFAGLCLGCLLCRRATTRSSMLLNAEIRSQR